jgi:phage N-6-adenine-methyltransferase
MVSNVLFESRSEEWGTPQELFNWLDGLFHFTLDPCASESNAKCAKHFTIEDDGLSQSWRNENVFMNPPYGRDIGKWMEKAALSVQENALTVCLVHARTDTKWWHNWVVYADQIWFIEGRLKFEGGQYSSTFPSVIVVFAPIRTEGAPRVRFLSKKEWRRK